MHNDKEQMQVEFHNRATASFFSIYHTFEEAISNVSRRSNESRFQQLKKQYAVTLERELQITAKDILMKYRNEKQMKEMDQMFHQFIKDYLHRFIRKVNDL
jgi:TRAP-type mannitol/chloroaromatic compound transport system substrate-binding protein